MTANGAAIVADPGADEVFAIWDARGAATPQFLAGPREGVSHPVGVAASADNQIYVANAGSGTIMALDANGALLRTHECTCVPSGLHRLMGSLFRLTDGVDRTLYLLDASPAEAHVLFVPPLLSHRGQEQVSADGSQ